MSNTRAGTANAVFAGAGELSTLCSRLDWSATALGAVESWPEALRSAVRICLDAATIPMAIWAGRDLTLIYNDAYITVLGPQKHPWALGRAARDVWPESWDRYGPDLRQVMELGQSVQHQDGRADTFIPIRDEDGFVIAALNIIHDDDNALRRSEALARARLIELEALYETAPIGLCVFDEHLRWVRVNQIIADINGRPIEDHIGRTPMEVVPDVGAQAEEALGTILRAGQRLDFEMTGITAAQPGVERCWSEHWVPIKDPAGRITGISVAAEDITDRKQAARALEESEERFRTLADNIAQFAWMADETGSIFWYNKRWYDYTGATLEEMKGWGWSKVHHPDHVDRVVEKIRRCFATGESWEDTFPLRGKDGAYRWFLSRAIAIRNESGEVVRWLGTNTDITEHRAAEEALRASERRKSEFLAVLSHDLRNPLAVIRTSLAVLERAGADSPPGKHALVVVGRQVNQMGRLLDDLLDLTRISTGKLLLKREPMQLNAIVRAIAEDHASLFERERIDFQVSVPPGPLYARVDGARITQAIGNLLQNAAKYTSEGGRVTLSLRTSDGGDAVIEVSDDGAGIQPELLGRLFDPLVQADRTLHQSRGGLGLGLAVVRGIVELHGGVVSAASEGPGRGAVFAIQLPLDLSPINQSMA